MSVAERMYETMQKELSAVVYGLKQFRQYLLGRHIIIRTDHAALSWLRRTPKPMPQLARWLMLIEQYDYEIAHRSGKRHGKTDGFSRKQDRRRDDEDIRQINCGNALLSSTLTNVEKGENEFAREGDELSPRKVRVIQKNGDGVTDSVGEFLHRQQKDDPELGNVIAM